jgi:antitoxin PrlF
MRTIEAKVTSQGQVTIPVEVRRRLGLVGGARVSFVHDDDGVRLEPAAFSLENVFGSVPVVPGLSDDLDDEIEEAMSDEADRRMKDWFGHGRP